MLQKIFPLLDDPQKPFIHRDLSWLQFNERVLAQSRAKENPLLERLRFLGITGSNLDEFFMIRFASLKEQIRSMKKNPQVSPEQVDRTRQTRDEILISAARFGERQLRTFNVLTKELLEKGIRVYRRGPSTPKLEDLARDIFEKYCLPQLKEPEKFTYESLKSLQNLQAAVIFPNGKMLSVPKTLPPAYYAFDEQKNLALFYLDDLVAHRMQQLLGSTKKPCIFRITRDADVSVDLEEEDPESIPDYIKKRMVSRDLGRPIRAQISGFHQMLNLDKVCKTLNISSLQVYKASIPLFIHGSYQIVNELQKQSFESKPLVFPPIQSRIPRNLQNKSQIFQSLRARDRLLHHPYDSFDAYVNFIEAALEDPQVTSISQTVYRVDTLSKVTDLLKAAARTKKVKVIIEPRARFDELNNIQLAEELRKAGVKVAFAFGKLKLHAKVALIERKEEGKTQYYTHLSTGNYNAATARLYTDLALLTAHQGIGQDAKNFLDAVSDERIPTNLQHLVLAPTELHKRLLLLIEKEIQAAKEGKSARIFAKMNALVDYNVVNSLYEASRAGVKIDLMIRGACSLIPKIKGLSENIRVLSVVDRFLEHSRLYYFQASNQVYLTSADWMPRNFFSRLELAFPILEPKLHEFLKDHMIPIYLQDRVKARELDGIGVWRKRKSFGGELDLQAQKIFEKLADSQYADTPLA
jgi:polyphosphate kinase